MILRSLRVSHLRCFRNPITVGPFGEGANILFGPNEAGKSTLMEAAAVALFDRHGTTGREVDSFQPWGTSLSPEVTVEFEEDGTCYRLEKTFLAAHRSLLSERIDAQYQPVHEGDTADNSVREMLLGEASGRGRTRPDQWGILRMLWSLQGSGGRGHLVVPRVTDAVADRLRAILGGAEVRSYLGDVIKRVEAACGEVYTDRRGDFRADSEVTRLRSKVRELTASRDELTAAVQEVEGWAAELEGLNREFGRIEEERKEIVANLAGHRDEAAVAMKTREQLKLAEVQETSRKRELTEAEASLAGYRRQEATYRERREEWRKLDAKHRGMQDEIAVIEQQVTEMQSALGAQEEDLAQLQRKLQRARQIQHARELQEQQRRLAGQASELAKLEARIGKLEDQLGERPVPTSREVKKATELEASCHRLTAQLESLGLRLTVRAEDDVTAVFKSEGKTRKHRLTPGGEVELSSASAATLSFPGVARVDIRSGATELADSQRELEQVVASLSELLARFGVATAADLAARAEWGELVRRDIRDRRAALAERAAPFETLADVRRQAAVLANQTEAAAKGLGLGSPKALEGLEAEDAETLGSAIDRIEKDLRMARQRAGKRSEEFEAARREALAAERGLAVCAQQRDSTQERAAEHLGEAADENALVARVRERRSQWEDAQRHTEALRRQLPAPEADPEELAKAATTALADADQRARQLQNRIAVMAANLEAAEAQGRYEKLNAVEEELAAAARQLGQALTRAVGLNLLRLVLRARRREAGPGSLQGIEERVSRILSAVTDRSGRYVRVGDDFAVSGFSSEAADTSTRDVQSLSAGTQEQLWMAFRIALSETYARKHGRQVMVLDDVLVYTDPDRHDRMLQVLRRAAEHLQVFILTSRPSLYRGLADTAYQFDIPSLRG